MHVSSLTNVPDCWTHPNYTARVRGTTYLWGSSGLTQNITFVNPLLLHIRNDRFGEAITIGTQVASGAKTTIGSLQPGEWVSIPLQKISAVFATCLLESNVDCLIKD
jgi:hypothetical protein